MCAEKLFSTQKYEYPYFIAYNYGNGEGTFGWGQCEVNTALPINHIKDIQLIQEQLEKDVKGKVIITNFKLLRKE